MRNKAILLVLICLATLGLSAQQIPQVQPRKQTSPLPVPRQVAPNTSQDAVCADVLQCPNQNAAGQQGTSSQMPRTGPVVLGSAPGAAGAQSAIKIGPGDLLLISVFDVPELNQQVRVGLNGEAVLPLIGSIKVAGLTPAQAGALIADKLKTGRFITNPEVSVFIQEYATQGVSVLGEVRQPGLYPAVGPRKLLDLLSQAGGTDVTASSEITIRRRSGEQEEVHLDMSGTAKQMLVGDIDIDPGDTVIVPRAGVVYVVGEVTRPGGYVMQDSGDLTILQAVALAQGFTTLASLNHVIILRRSGDHPGVQMDIHLKDILKGRQPDIKLGPNDVLYLPRNVPKAAMLIALDDAVRGLTALAYYAR